MAKTPNLNDRELVGAYKRCKSNYGCDGCSYAGSNACRSQMLNEIARRFVKIVENREVENENRNG